MLARRQKRLTSLLAKFGCMVSSVASSSGGLLLAASHHELAAGEVVLQVRRGRMAREAHLADLGRGLVVGEAEVRDADVGVGRLEVGIEEQALLHPGHGRLQVALVAGLHQAHAEEEARGGVRGKAVHRAPEQGLRGLPVAEHRLGDAEAPLHVGAHKVAGQAREPSELGLCHAEESRSGVPLARLGGEGEACDDEGTQLWLLSIP
mmetsp:Transcript_78824/g.244600  ORF Transcript_78824/g.244600 Transcript_78824/m.244600 type:complete len:206 (+) Transcript_78824:284-901(+)